MNAPKPLDHGVLNVPLSKRGNIDAQIDRALAEQAKTKREATRELVAAFNASRTEAFGLIADMTPEHVARLAVKLGCQPRSVAKRLHVEAGINPALVVKALREGGAA